MKEISVENVLERILNICDMPVAILLSYSKMLGLSDWTELDPEYFGLNHFGWFTALYDQTGKDRLPELREKIIATGMEAVVIDITKIKIGKKLGNNMPKL